jgi:hypothetical protein
MILKIIFIMYNIYHITYKKVIFVCLMHIICKSKEQKLTTDIGT